MTDRLEDLRRRMDGLDQIGEVVGALKAISSGQSAAARAAVAAISAHAETVTRAMALIAAEVPRPSRHQEAGAGLLLVVGASQGFAGAYPQHLVEATLRMLEPGLGVLVLGHRTITGLQDEGVDILWSDDLAGHPDAIPALASRVADALMDLATEHSGPIRALVGRSLDVPVTLFPPVRGPTNAPLIPPLTTLPPADLLAALLREDLFAAVALALMQGLEAEATARMHAMGRAKSNLRDRRLGVEAAFHQARQEQMTTELIELSVAGRGQD